MKLYIIGISEKQRYIKKAGKTNNKMYFLFAITLLIGKFSFFKAGMPT